MSLDVLRSTARGMVDLLVRGDYESAVKVCIKSRLTSEDLRTIIRDYGRKLVSPPAEVYNKLDAIQVKDASVPTWSVRAPLWTKEEGRSDLTLELTIIVMLGSGPPSIALDDLRVL